MNGLCGMLSVDETLPDSDDSFGDSNYGMPIGAHYYMDNVRSEFGEDGSDSPDFGTEGFPEEFFGGPITFGEDFGADPYPISGGWNPAAVDILFQTVAGSSRGINPQFSDWLLHGSQGGGRAFNHFLVGAGEQRGPAGHAVLATDWITDAYQMFPTQMAIIRSQFPDVAALINSAVNGAQPRVT